MDYQLIFGILIIASSCMIVIPLLMMGEAKHKFFNWIITFLGFGLLFYVVRYFIPNYIPNEDKTEYYIKVSDYTIKPIEKDSLIFYKDEQILTNIKK